ncbi:hypothetical protein [Candidatus Protochlamydia phocaeensis]|uniref:hypothetical protein n=1 Tax=Candidatus Protochlamydia phocaeensis TaxID=1414722 RepID=UPI000B10CC0B|nr:hypothetical protein [Candidatus Protochlamydia phocaeensis]
MMQTFPPALRLENGFIPLAFRDGRPIERIILILDVDGVVRDSTEAVGDPRVLSAIKALLQTQTIDSAFISGTPVFNDPSLEPWRRGNTPLSQVFGSFLDQELKENRAAVYGLLGGQRMTEKGGGEILETYSLEQTFAVGRLLLQAFLKQVLQDGTDEQSSLAVSLQAEIKELELKNKRQSIAATPEEFCQIAETIRQRLDPDFRLISNGALIETHTSNPPWHAALASSWFRQACEQPSFLPELHVEQKQISTGLAKRGDRGFNFLLICRTNKGLTIKKHIEDKLRRFPEALIVTIGDTLVDFPMHQHAHLAFHVGLEQVWQSHPLPQCVMVRDKMGKDSQHVEGTLQILQILQEGIGKPFPDLKCIQKMDASGLWQWHSPRELETAKLD